MKNKRILMILLSLPLAVTAMAQEDEVTDIDEWQVLKVEAAKDPFANTNQFTINFANYTAEEWHYPLPGAHLISPFGGARHHGGTDVKTRPNDTIRAAFPGEVILSGPYYGYGNCVVLRHANGLETLYSHHSKILVKVGRWVQAGEPLALEGRTGRATTEHLHFETRVKGKAFNSELLFDHNANQLIRQVVVFTKLPNGQLKITTSKPDETKAEANKKESGE
jgi:murein DD-endopeptidase MepM/ murein hydrolase activator NlpD